MPTLGFLNANYRQYSDGKSVVNKGVTYDLTWKNARAKRLASLMKNDVCASLYGVAEMDTEMMEDVCRLYASKWKHIGGDNYFTSAFDGDAHDKNGFLYDSSKWTWDFLGNWTLPGGGTRALLGVDWIYLPTGKKRRIFITHLSSAAPLDRVIQMNRVLEIIGDQECIFMSDLNSQSTKEVTSLTALAQNPRVQLPLTGFVEAPYQPKPYPTFNGYGLSVTSRLDYVGISPAAAKSGSIVIESAEIIPAMTPPSGEKSAFGTDHNPIRASVKF